jgi:hypothetical protein
VDAYNEISLLYGVIQENCVPTKETCKVGWQGIGSPGHGMHAPAACANSPVASEGWLLSWQVMNAGAEFEYLWADNSPQYKKPTKVSCSRDGAMVPQAQAL